MEEERDLVTFSDEDGNEFDLEVIDYFDYEGQEYAALIDAEPDEESDGTVEHHGHEPDALPPGGGDHAPARLAVVAGLDAGGAGIVIF